ncbi:MAG: fatty acid CoA ligase family protein [Pirellulales bacterium]
MAEVDVSTVAATPARLNVADRLAESAARSPDGIAVACPRRHSAGYTTITFSELDADATCIARGLVDWGVTSGTRLVLVVRPGIEFVTLVFALLRAGAVIVLVDPGLGRKNLIRCLAEAQPEGFVAIPVVQAARLCLRHKFPGATWIVTVGWRWFWGGLTLADLRERGTRFPKVTLPKTRADDAAAIIFTSGSTGPPKGVHYTQRMFDTQVAAIQSMYGIEPGGVDLSCFPLFALFNSAMGVTTVLPQMDFSRPASADPEKLLAAANDWKVTQAFASPAVWRKLGAHCAKTGDRIHSLRQVFSCGAPVSADVLRSTLALAAPNASMHTPYGATECLPVATIEATEVLGETAARTDEGAGVCVGRKFDSIDWRIIRITDDPIAEIDDAEELPTGEIGELIVRGPQASPRYITRIECSAEAKIRDGERAGSSSTPRFWHRMGDVGYFDDAGCFWYCGRKSQRVESQNGPVFTEQVEAIVNAHPAVRRSALVGIGPRGAQTPIVIVEPSTPFVEEHALDFEIVPYLELAQQLLGIAATSTVSVAVKRVLFYPLLPVDVRHNAKINREQLSVWAATQLPELA